MPVISQKESYLINVPSRFLSEAVIRALATAAEENQDVKGCDVGKAD